jgi:hypothetical protein
MQIIHLCHGTSIYITQNLDYANARYLLSDRKHFNRTWKIPSPTIHDKKPEN